MENVKFKPKFVLNYCWQHERLASVADKFVLQARWALKDQVRVDLHQEKL